MFDGDVILIVEDQPFIALDLADTVVSLGGSVFGPFATVTETLANLGSKAISGAIVDVMLLDRDITPVAVYLAENSISVVVHSATEVPGGLARRYPDLAVIAKPAPALSVVSRLKQLMQLASSKS